MATLKDELDKIEKVGKLEKAAQPADLEIPEEITRLAPNKERFDQLMVPQDKKPEKIEVDNKVDPVTKRSSVFDEARDFNTAKTENLKVTPTELIAQAEQAADKMEAIKNRLQTPGVELKDSTSTLLRNKLTHIDDNINIALTKAGSEISSPKEGGPLTASNNPIMRFLGMLTDGQSKLQTLASDINKMHLNKVEFNPATMLAIQIKVNYISQELEFFSSLLNKSLESTKTIMNVQV